MAGKRGTTMGLILARTAQRKSSVSVSRENAFPLVLNGRAIQQLPLPREFVTNESRGAGNVAEVKASNLAEVRAKLKLRKQQLG